MTTAPVLMIPLPRSEPPAYAVPQPRRHLRLVEPAPQLTIDDIMRRHAEDDAGADPLTAAIPAAEAELPPIATFARTYFTAVGEVLIGRRSADQLARSTALHVMQTLRSVAPRTTSRGAVASPRVRAVHVGRVREAVIEATAVIQHGPHVRAMNARFVGLDGRWQCHYLQLV